jgi:hypothetical protein
MLNSNNLNHLRTIKNWFDEICYSTINDSIISFICQKKILYPDYKLINSNMDKLNPYYAFIVSLFRLGQPSEQIFINRYIPSDVFHALSEVGLLINKDNYWQMPELSILPLNSLYFVVGLPNNYPSVLRDSKFKCITEDTLSLVYDQKINKKHDAKYLELSSDYGVISINAALKGYKNITIHPRSKIFVPLIKFNIGFNDFEDVNFKIASLNLKESIEKFDFISGNVLLVYYSYYLRTISKEEILKDNELEELFIQIDNLLMTNGSMSLILESFGTQYEILFNKGYLGNDRMKSSIRSIVLNKLSYYAYLQQYIKEKQADWEVRLESIPTSHFKLPNLEEEEVNPQSEMLYVFKQLLKHNINPDTKIVLHPLYNPKYSDPLFNYACLI